MPGVPRGPERSAPARLAAVELRLSLQWDERGGSAPSFTAAELLDGWICARIALRAHARRRLRTATRPCVTQVSGVLQALEMVPVWGVRRTRAGLLSPPAGQSSHRPSVWLDSRQPGAEARRAAGDPSASLKERQSGLLACPRWSPASPLEGGPRRPSGSLVLSPGSGKDLVPGPGKNEDGVLSISKNVPRPPRPHASARPIHRQGSLNGHALESSLEGPQSCACGTEAGGWETIPGICFKALHQQREPRLGN